jgi:transcriptional regulator with XRE-family HTH domain
VSAADAVPTVAEQLRRRRSALGWTLEQLAEQAQVSVGMLSLIETGKRRPQLMEVETLEEARRKLGVPTDYGYAWEPLAET